MPHGPPNSSVSGLGEYAICWSEAPSTACVGYPCSEDNSCSNGTAWLCNGAQPLGLVRKVWHNLPGKTLADLLAAAAFPDSPDLEEFASALTSTANYGDNYGQMFYGLFVAPETGSYVFEITSDENSELRISDAFNDTQGQVVSYISEAQTWYQGPFLRRGYAPGPDAWDSFPTQSGSYYMEAGHLYYLEVLHKERVQSDHLIAGVRLPSGIVHRPIPASFFDAVVCTQGLPVGLAVVHDCTGRKTGQSCTAQCRGGWSGAQQTFVCDGVGILHGRDPVCTAVQCEEYSVEVGSLFMHGVWDEVDCSNMEGIKCDDQLRSWSGVALLCAYDASDVLRFCDLQVVGRLVDAAFSGHQLTVMLVSGTLGRGESDNPILFIRKHWLIELQEEALPAQQPTAEPSDLTEAESLAAGADDESSGQMPPDVGKSHEDLMQSPTVALALPIYAPAPPPDKANAYALINGETPWSAVAVCRQQAERLAQLEAEILEECRQKQERLFQSEFAEVLDQRAQEWRQQRLELESQISYQEQRFTSAQVAWRQSEVNAQRDAQMRHQAISDRCLAISEELAVARAGFETERFQLEQDVGRLQAEIVMSANEANAVKLEARTMNSCLQQELSAEVSTAAHLVQSAASRRDEALSECQAAESKLAKQQLEQRSNVDELLRQRTSLEEHFHYAEHQQRLSQQRASQEGDNPEKIEVNI
ncbi:ppdK [Symbiodinium sp. CCMP2456]|nr:ppdK [Symbiodinium sp. CCMP2456]